MKDPIRKRTSGMAGQGLRAHRADRNGRVRGLVLMCALGSVLSAGGCENDSFFDPSTAGRWEHTPTKIPILERIVTIEDSDGVFVQTSAPTAEDLLPEVESYRLAPGDTLVVRIQDFNRENEEAEYQRLVDSRGNIDLPRLDSVRVQGLTVEQVKSRVIQAVQDKSILVNPIVTVVFGEQRQATFSVLGAVANAGQFIIPEPNYRLLQGLTAAGGLPETTPELYIIRQIPLSEEARGRSTDPGVGSSGTTGTNGTMTPVEPAGTNSQEPQGEDILKLIDELAPPQGAGSGTSDGGGTPSPGVVGARRGGLQPSGGEPPISIDALDSGSGMVEATGGGSETSTTVGGGRWVYREGKWVRVSKASPSQASSSVGANGSGPEAPVGFEGRGTEGLVTQRVIAVPVKPLLAGNARYNLVIRPGDVIRVPQAERGNIYIQGKIVRPGAFDLPATGKLTLMQALAAAGGFNEEAIPERVDLVRRVGPNMQAIVRLDCRAIEEGTAPDVFLKPDDRINVGTNFFAYPLAVIRNGFRVSYGFGFLVDRNFGNDIFGPPPVNRFGE